uniref:Uncharacterized protein n=1 Tax=Megaselia scalaris TaxID=36166 RepID=T1GRS1_MEGSC
MSKSVDTSFIPDLPKAGPLSEYRKRAKFDWKDLKLIFEEEQTLKTKYRVWKLLEEDPLFAKSKTSLPTNELKRLAAMQMNHMAKLNLVPDE